MGVETGVDLGALIEASRAVQEVLGRPLGAHVLRAGPVEWTATSGRTGAAGQAECERRIPAAAEAKDFGAAEDAVRRGRRSSAARSVFKPYEGRDAIRSLLGSRASRCSRTSATPSRSRPATSRR